MQPRLAAVCWLIISNCQMGELCKKRLGVMMKITGLMVGYWGRGGVMAGQAMIYSQLRGSGAIKIIRFQ